MDVILTRDLYHKPSRDCDYFELFGDAVGDAPERVSWSESKLEESDYDPCPDCYDE